MTTASKPSMTDDSFMFSPAGDLSAGWDVGGGSTPAAITVFPDFDVAEDLGAGSGTGTSGDGASFGEDFGAPPTKGSVDFVQVATGAPTGYDAAGLGDMMVGGLGIPPRPGSDK